MYKYFSGIVSDINIFKGQLGIKENILIFVGKTLKMLEKP